MRRRPFQPGANIPMTIETFDRLALELRMAGEALIAYPTIDTYNALSKMFATLNRAGMEGGAFDLATGTMNAICDRFETAGAISVSPDDAEQLRTAIFSIEPALPKLPVNRLRQALADVAAFCVTVGLEESVTDLANNNQAVPPAQGR
jgi:hypothetical protein